MKKMKTLAQLQNPYASQLTGALEGSIKDPGLWIT